MNRARFAIAGSLACAILAASSCDEGLPTSPAQFSAALQASGSWPDTLDAGERTTIHASVQVNNLTVEGAVVQWHVSAPRILFVDTTTSHDSTSIRGLRPGTATVSATLADQALTTQTINHEFTVRLRGVHVAAPLTDTTLTAFADTILVRAAGLTGASEDVDSAGVTFTATGAALRTVDQSPDSLWLTSVANGTARVVVSHTLCAGKCADTVLVTVRQVPATVVAPDTVHVSRLQDPRALEATVRDRNGFVVADSTPRWALVSGAGVVALDPDGTVTGLSNGTARAVASVGGAADTVVLEVAQVVAGAEVSDSLITFNAVALDDTLTLELTDSSGVSLDRPVSISWQSSDAGVATVTPLATDSARAVVQSVAVGEAYVRASAEGKQDSTLVRVTQTPASVVVQPAADTLNALGDTTELAATARDDNGQAIPGAAVTWTSLDTLVATVSADGAVVGRGTGTARISASFGDVADTAEVLVRQVPAAVVVTGTVDSLAAGDTTTFAAAVADSNGAAVAAAAVAWSSSDTTIAVVDQNGVVTGASTGTATITATASPASGVRDITVTGLVVDTVAVTPDSLHFASLGDTLRAGAQALNPQGNPIPGVAITWSSSDTAVATVGADGLVTSVADGTAEITADADGVTTSVPVVVAQEVAVVQVTPASRTFTSLTETVAFTATVTDALGTPVAGAVVTWGSNDTLVATVDGTGTATAVADGATYIVADASGVRDSAMVTVGQVVSNVTVTPDPTDTLTAVADTLHLTATVTDASSQTVTNPGTSWTSRNAGVASVDSTGIVTAVANGTTRVVAEAGGVRDSVTVTVAQAVASVTTTPASATLVSLGETLQVTATIKDSGGTPVSGASATWESTDSAVATVTDGVVTAVADGSAKIIAAADGKVDTTAITVNQTVATVAVTPSARTLTSKVDSVQLSASATDSLGSAVAGAGFTWSTASGSGVVTVNTSGLVISNTTGVDTVVATSGSAQDSAIISVTQVVASITITPQTANIAVRDTAALAVTAAQDSNGYTISTPTITWASLDTDTATVVGAGTTANVIGVDGGTAEIRAASGTVADTATITVLEYALEFDGNNDFASMSTELRLDTFPAWTVELWVRRGNGSGDEYLFMKGNDGSDITDNKFDYAVLLRDGAPTLFVQTQNNAQYAAVADDTLTQGAWHHVAFTYDGSSAVLYVDGSSASAPGSGTSGAAKDRGNTNFIGAYGSSAGDGNFIGGLDEIRVWHGARSGAQILAAHATRLTGTEVGLAAYWPTDAGTGNPKELVGNYGVLNRGGGTASQQPAWSTASVPPIH